MLPDPIELFQRCPFCSSLFSLFTLLNTGKCSVPFCQEWASEHFLYCFQCKYISPSLWRQTLSPTLGALTFYLYIWCKVQHFWLHNPCTSIPNLHFMCKKQDVYPTTLLSLNDSDHWKKQIVILNVNFVKHLGLKLNYQIVKPVKVTVPRTISTILTKGMARAYLSGICRQFTFPGDWRVTSWKPQDCSKKVRQLANLHYQDPTVVSQQRAADL